MVKNSLAPVIAVINMKGGVGKTTISAHLFRVMFGVLRAGTLILDLDPQFNLTQCLFTRDNYDRLKKAGKTIYSALEPLPPAGLFEIKTSPSPPPRPKEIGITLWHFRKTVPLESLMVVPGDFDLVKYNLMDDNRKLTAVRNRFNEFVKIARNDFKVVCIDCNPSSSFLTLCALHSCTHILVPVRPDRYSILGLEILSDFVDSIPTIHKKPEIIVLLNGIPGSDYNDNVEKGLRAHPVFGALTLANKIYLSKLLAASPDYTGFATDKKVPYRNRVKRDLKLVVNELAQRLGIS